MGVVAGPLPLSASQWRGEEAPSLATLDHRRVIAISREYVIRRGRKGVLNHLKQRMALGFTINNPVRGEDFVAAVLRVRLGKHHQLDIARVATKLNKRSH